MLWGPLADRIFRGPLAGRLSLGSSDQQTTAPSEGILLLLAWTGCAEPKPTNTSIQVSLGISYFTGMTGRKWFVVANISLQVVLIRWGTITQSMRRGATPATNASAKVIKMLTATQRCASVWIGLYLLHATGLSSQMSAVLGIQGLVEPSVMNVSILTIISTHSYNFFFFFYYIVFVFCSLSLQCIGTCLITSCYALLYTYWQAKKKGGIFCFRVKNNFKNNYVCISVTSGLVNKILQATQSLTPKRV